MKSKIIILGICLTRFLFAQENPNIIFIYADDMGYGEIEALNPERSKIPTPHLNQLVKEGMEFTDAHTTSSVCTPSRYGLLTGRYNWRTKLQKGVVTGGKPCLIAPGRLTLAQLLKAQGYHTGIFGKWHLDYEYHVPKDVPKVKRRKKEGFRLASVPVGATIVDGPLTRGFDTFYGFHHARSMSSVVEGDKIIKEVHETEILPLITQKITEYIGERAAEAKEGKPFFAYFPMSSPHTPISPAEEWKGKTELGAYGDFVAQTDGSVGAVMQALEEHGLKENTIIIFSADNGSSRVPANFEYLESKGHYPSAHLRGAKADLWEGGHRVPFILRWPAQVKASSKSHQLISLADMMATFAEMLDVDLKDNQGEDSVSFYSELSGEEGEAPRESIVFHSYTGKFSIRQAEWKLLLAHGSGGWSAPKDDEARKKGLLEYQLYNMADDVSETKNLASEYPEKVENLITLLKKYVEDGRSTLGAKQKNDVENIDLFKVSGK